MLRWLRSDRFLHDVERTAVASGYAMMLGYLGQVLVPDLERFFVPVSAWALMVFMVGMTVSGQHDQLRCQRCIADFPHDDGNDIAHRHRWSLGSFHLCLSLITVILKGLLYAWCWIRRKRELTVSVRLWVAAAVVWVPIIVVAVFLPAPYGSALQMGFMLWFVVAGSRHRRLQAWCPWCRNDDGDDDDDGEEIPDPDPAPGKQIHA